MAVVTSEIRQDGLGDYTTLAAFEAATDLNSGADIWDGWCSQAGDSFDESFTFNVDGTSATSHVRLRGPAVGTKATINYTGAATQAVLVTTADWLDLEDLIIARSGGGPGSSDEGIRFSGSAENVKISRCIFWTPLDVTQMDGIYIAAGTYSISIDNSLFYGWDRAGIHEQSLSGGSSVTLNLDHNTGVFCGAGDAGSEQAPLSIRNNSSGNVTVVNGYNNVWKSHDNSSDGTSYADIFVRSGSGSTVTFNGSHDCMDDLSTLTDGLTTDNRTNLVSATAGVVETDTASAVIITETTRDATFDATPQELANNVIIGAGTNRQGSEPDPRQDFSVDLWGNARPTANVDIGAIQVSPAVVDLDAATAVVGLADVELTHTFSVSPGTDRALIVGVAVEYLSPDETVTAVDYGGQAMTLLAEIDSGEASGFDAYVSLWILLDAGISAASNTTITPTYSSPSEIEGVQVHAASYEGVDQTGGATTLVQSNTAATGTSTPNPISIGLSGTAAGNLVAALAVSGEQSTTAWHSDLVEQTDVNVGGSGSTSSFARVVSAGGALTIEPTFGSQNRAAGVSVEIAASTGGGGGTNAPAGAATGTGAGQNATTSIAAPAAVAAGTGTAADATASTTAATNAPAAVAAGTGTAANATTSIAAPAAVAAGTGAGQDATSSVAAVAAVATGTGAGLDGTVSTSSAANAPAGVAAGTGAGQAASASIGVPATVAAGTGTATDATVSTTSATNAPASVAAGTGTGHDGTVSTTSAATAPASVAAGTGTGQAAGTSASTPAGVAAGTGTGHDGTASTVAERNAPATVAPGTGTGHNPTGSTTASAGTAAGAGAGTDPVPAAAARPPAATSTGAAHDASVVITADGAGNAAVAAGTGAGHDATALVQSVGQAFAQFAAGAGAGQGPSLAVAMTAVPAAAVGAAFEPAEVTISPSVTPNVVGGWNTLAAIWADAAAERVADAAAGPRYCPNDDELLVEDAHGRLVCPWDGWRPVFSR